MILEIILSLVVGVIIGFLGNKVYQAYQLRKIFRGLAKQEDLKDLVIDKKVFSLKVEQEKPAEVIKDVPVFEKKKQKRVFSKPAINEEVKKENENLGSS